jgi:tRNA(adenine34) deaminase
MTLASDHESLMEMALEEARKAKDLLEVPIGCVIVAGDTIVARAHNRVETNQCATAHAEMLALNEASRSLGRWRLADCTLCVTLEPCFMCLGAIKLARLQGVVYGAGDSRQGAFSAGTRLAADTTTGPSLTVVSGIRADTCAQLLKDFFAERRTSRK